LLHRTNPEARVTVPIHSKDIPPTLLNRILRQAALSEEEFAKFI
jgi:predicted RNA binding protein YcfA (HicA-like mRNA interferase family)